MSGSTGRRVPTDGRVRRLSRAGTRGVRLLIGLSLLTSLATVGAALGPAQNASASGGACSTSNEAVTVMPDTSLDNLFQNYGNSGSGDLLDGRRRR